MKFFLLQGLFTVLWWLSPAAGGAQAQLASSESITGQPFSEEGLFESDEVLSIKLSGNLRELIGDREGTPKYFPLVISYKSKEGGEVSLSAEARARGHFRRSMGKCTYPPLLLHFSKSDSLRSSIFRKQSKLKLVMPCRGDEYVVREWLVYKIYNLVTPKSFRARLVSVELNDTKRNKGTPPFYGILLEEDQQMAKRNHNVLLKNPMRPEQVDPASFLTMAVFEYLIGNTDWSVQYLQNVKLLAADSNSVPVTVPFDFDHAGVVNAPYAKPAEELLMKSVRERRYRGYCVADMAKFDEVIELYNRLKKDIYGLYSGCALLDEKYKNTTMSYFDEFYKTVNNSATVKKEFTYPCDKNGTGNVVIRGLKEDE